MVFSERYGYFKGYIHYNNILMNNVQQYCLRTVMYEVNNWFSIVLWKKFFDPLIRTSILINT